MFVITLSVSGVVVLIFFFFKQKTAYEMRIMDGSSDVCSSDLGANPCASVAEGKVPGAFSDLPGKSMQKDGGGLLGQFPPPPSTGAASACSCSSVWKRGSSRIGSQTGWIRSSDRNQ